MDLIISTAFFTFLSAMLIIWVRITVACGHNIIDAVLRSLKLLDHLLDVFHTGSNEWIVIGDRSFVPQYGYSIFEHGGGRS